MRKILMIQLIYIFYIAIALTMIGGWVANIYKLIGIIHEPISSIFIARFIGLFVPFIGGVLGFM